MKYYFLLFTALLFSNLVPAQTYYYYSHTEYTYGPYYFDQTLNFVNQMILSKERKEKAEAERQRMIAQSQKMRDYFGSFEKYPASVPDGWHSVVILGGQEFIGDRKALVENGRVKTLVWDNWMPEELTFSGPIQQGQTAVRLKGGTGPLGGLVDVYFMNQVGDNPTQADPPLKLGSITFWCSGDEKQLGRYKIVFEDAVFGPFSEHRDWNNPAECGDTKQIIVYYKPGTYNYRLAPTWAEGRSITAGTVAITEGGCTLVEVYDPRGKQKGPKKKKQK